MRFLRAYSSTAASLSKLPRFLKLYPLIVILLVVSRAVVVDPGAHDGTPIPVAAEDPAAIDASDRTTWPPAGAHSAAGDR